MYIAYLFNLDDEEMLETGLYLIATGKTELEAMDRARMTFLERIRDEQRVTSGMDQYELSRDEYMDATHEFHAAFRGESVHLRGHVQQEG